MNERPKIQHLQICFSLMREEDGLVVEHVLKLLQPDGSLEALRRSAFLVAELANSGNQLPRLGSREPMESIILENKRVDPTTRIIA